MNKILDYNPAIEGDILDYEKEPEKFKYMELDNEIYKKYCVSTYGRVFNIETHYEYSRIFDDTGFPYVQITMNKKKRKIYLHKLVANHFIPRTKTDILNKRDKVTFLDGDSDNVHIGNLKWETLTNIRGIMHQKISDKTVHKVCQCLEEGKSLAYIESKFKKLGVTYNIAYNIASKRTWIGISNQYNINYKKKNLRKNKLSPKLVHYICQLLEEGVDIYIIRRKLGPEVTYNMIYPIAVGRTWKEISSQYNIHYRGGEEAC